MSEQKEVTPTLFGLVIAYVVPGLFALFTGALFSDDVGSQLRSFAGAESSVGLFLLVILTALLIGMVLQAFRWAVFEKFIFSKSKLNGHDLKNLRKSAEATASFRLLIDELYRYHQSYGALAFVVPFFFWGLGWRLRISFCSSGGLVLVILSVIFIFVIGSAAAEGWTRYVDRSNSLLRGD